MYRFKSFLLDTRERRLLNGSQEVHLTPKVFDLLVMLVEREGLLVNREELMRSIWPDAIVEEGNLTKAIHSIRKALNEDENGNRFIETVPTRGYRFVAKVESVAPAECITAVDDQPMHSPTTPVNSDQVGRPRTYRRSYAAIIGLAFVGLAVLLGLPFLVASKSKSQQTKDNLAYQHYQQGRFFIERSLRGDSEQALDSFEKAIKLDPNYAAAYAGKAHAKFNIFGTSRSHDDIAEARLAATKAIAIDNSSSYAHTMMCRIASSYDWKFDEAEKECREAVRLDDKNPDAQRQLALTLILLGKDTEALAAVNKANELAPTLVNKRARGQLLYYCKRYDEAIEEFLGGQKDPRFNLNYSWVSKAYAMKGDWEHAFEFRVKDLEWRNKPEEVEAVKTAYDREGWSGVSKLSAASDEGMSAAAACARLGEHDKAFKLLESAVAKRLVMVPHIKREPAFDPIRNDPRFVKLLEGIFKPNK